MGCETSAELFEILITCNLYQFEAADAKIMLSIRSSVCSESASYASMTEKDNEILFNVTDCL